MSAERLEIRPEAPARAANATDHAPAGPDINRHESRLDRSEWIASRLLNRLRPSIRRVRQNIPMAIMVVSVVLLTTHPFLLTVHPRLMGLTNWLGSLSDGKQWAMRAVLILFALFHTATTLRRRFAPVG